MTDHAMQPSTDLSPDQGKGGVESDRPKVCLAQLEPYSSNQGQTLILAQFLRDKGWDACIVCRAPALASAARKHSIPVHILPEGKGLLTAWRLLRIMRKHGISGGKDGLLHALDTPASHLASLVWRLNKKLRILHTRRMPVMEQSHKTVRCYLLPPAKVVTDSLAGKIALRLSGLEPHLLHTIACGVEYPVCPARRERKDGRIVFAVTGELAPGKGHSLLFEALTRLGAEADLPSWEVRALGRGPALGDLLDEAVSRNVADRLVFLSEADPEQELAACDILVLPASEGESHAPLILQGWGAGLPVVAVNRLDHAEMLQDEGNCLLSQPNDAVGLAAQMARLARDAALRDTLSRNGLVSLKKFDARSMAGEYSKLYHQILA